jgi:hypothetical protein
MADAVLLNNNIVPNQTPVRWSAIFAGTFVFLAIEATFGVLGTAIFAGAANPNAAQPVTGMSAGIGIWMLVLSIISLYVAGRTAGHFSGSTARNEAWYYGLATFGLCIFTLILVTAMTMGAAVTPTTAGKVAAAAPSTVGSIIATGGFWLWITMLLGGLAAMWGSSNAIGSLRTPATVHDIRDRDVRKVA